MSRLPYEPPHIQTHFQDLVVNQHGRTQTVQTDIDGVSVEDLVAAHGSPLIVFSEKILRNRIRAMRDAFLQRYPKVRFGWSYKTNYLDAICGVLHQEGWDAEVVSELEYQMARRIGIPGDRIVCNGACKPRSWLERIVDEGAFVQIDHYDELILLEEIARERQQVVPIGVRINLRAHPLKVTWERFGFNYESQEAYDACIRICQSQWLQLKGLHCHLGTFIPAPEAYTNAALKLAHLTNILEDRTDTHIEFINLGGGFPSSNVLATPLAAHAEPPDVEAFARAVSSALRGAFKDRPQLPTLILESGRALVDDAGTLIATVVGARRLLNGARGIILDVGLNVLYTAHWYRHPIELAQHVPGPDHNTMVYGPLCMNIDALGGPIPLPQVTPGHRLLLQNVGAYNVTQWMQFSQPRPAVVMIDTDAQVHLLRRAETIDDVKGPELLPKRYQTPR